MWLFTKYGFFSAVCARQGSGHHGQPVDLNRIMVRARLRTHLEALKDRHESGQINSVEFLKKLLELARDLLEAEKDTPPEEDEDRGKAALTELFLNAKNDNTPVMVERVVNDIDEIVRLVRFPGWQQTSAGEREVRRALRKTLFKYKLHQDKALKKVIADRYAGYRRGMGKKVMAGQASLVQLEQWAMKQGEPEMTSGRQELLENLLNQYIFEG